MEAPVPDNMPVIPRAVMTVVAILGIASLAAAQPTVVRGDHLVAGVEGLQIYVREVVPHKAAAGIPPVLLVHGARVPSLASFDLQVPGGSLAADLAAAGLRVYLMDVRGYGRSTRPPRMSEPPVPGAPLVRASDAIEDIGTIVDWIRARNEGAGRRHRRMGSRRALERALRDALSSQSCGAGAPQHDVRRRRPITPPMAPDPISRIRRGRAGSRRARSAPIG